jgi:hypothetical protein
MRASIVALLQVVIEKTIQAQANKNIFLQTSTGVNLGSEYPLIVLRALQNVVNCTL